MPVLINNPGGEKRLALTTDPQGFFPNAQRLQTNLSDDQAGMAAYNEYQITTTHRFDTGLAGMPVAGPKGTPSRIVRLDSGSCVKVVDWIAQRLGEQPVLPHWDTDNPNEVLLSKVIETLAPVLQPNGIDLAWHMAGQYVYRLQVVPGDEEELSIPSTVILRTQAIPFSLRADRFDRNLLRSLYTGPTLTTRIPE